MKMLFLVSHNNKVLYYCNSILELFRLRAIYTPPPEAKLYRWFNTVTYTDAYFKWDEVSMWWVESSKELGTGFGACTFESLEPAWKMMGGK